MHFIKSIVEITPYTITVIFENNEQRKINFEPILSDFPVLKNPGIFNSATLDDYPTLKWDGLAKLKELDGTIVSAPLDFSPDMLYMMSKSA